MGFRRHLVAAFVLFHGASTVGLSLPRLPEPLSTGDTSPLFEAFLVDVSAWSAALVPPVRAGALAYVRLTDGLRTVFGPYARATGTSQGWTMFGSVPTRVERVEIWVRHDAGWEARYVAGSDTATWRRALLENERVRTFLHGAAQGRTKKNRFAQFADWADRELRAEDPTIRQVKVQFVRLTIPPAEELARTGALTAEAPFQVQVRPRRSR